MAFEDATVVEMPDGLSGTEQDLLTAGKDKLLDQIKGKDDNEIKANDTKESVFGRVEAEIRAKKPRIVMNFDKKVNNVMTKLKSLTIDKDGDLEQTVDDQPTAEALVERTIAEKQTEAKESFITKNLSDLTSIADVDKVTLGENDLTFLTTDQDRTAFLEQAKSEQKSSIVKEALGGKNWVEIRGNNITIKEETFSISTITDEDLDNINHYISYLDENQQIKEELKTEIAQLEKQLPDDYMNNMFIQKMLASQRMDFEDYNNDAYMRHHPTHATNQDNRGRIIPYKVSQLFGINRNEITNSRNDNTPDNFPKTGQGAEGNVAIANKIIEMNEAIKKIFRKKREMKQI